MQEFIRDSREKIRQTPQDRGVHQKKYLLVNYFMRLSQNMRNLEKKKGGNYLSSYRLIFSIPPLSSFQVCHSHNKRIDVRDS